MENLSILVVSCDRYADVWPVFFNFFWKYWPDCPYPVYLGANQKTFSNEKVNMVLTGDDPSWAESTRRMIEQVPGDYVLLLLEDFLLQETVASEKIEYLFNAFQTLDGAYLRLRPRLSKPDKKVDGYPEIGEIEPGAPYRVALQVAIWKKSILLELLKDGETAWEMELLGSIRSNDFRSKFYSTWLPKLNYFSAITLGKWTRQAYHYSLQAGIELNFKARPLMSRREDLLLKLRRMRSKIIWLIPWKWRKRIRLFLNSILDK